LAGSGGGGGGADKERGGKKVAGTQNLGVGKTPHLAVSHDLGKKGGGGRRWKNQMGAGAVGRRRGRLLVPWGTGTGEPADEAKKLGRGRVKKEKGVACRVDQLTVVEGVKRSVQSKGKKVMGERRKGSEVGVSRQRTVNELGLAFSRN